MKRAATQTHPPRRSARLANSEPAPQSPERIDFIERLTRPLFDDGANKQPFVFKSTASGYSCGMVTRTDTVHLHLACTSRHVKHAIRLECFPVSGTDKVPDAALLAAPYPVSVNFWRRVRACEIDEFLVFDRHDMSEFQTWNSFPARSSLMRGADNVCFAQAMHAVDLILTFVLDHVGCVRGSTPSVMSEYFKCIAMCFPHALLAHAHRWGDSSRNALFVYPSFGGYDAFWRTYDAACARMQLPATLDCVRFINVESLDVAHTNLQGINVPSSFGPRFPSAESVVVKFDANMRFVSDVALAFPTVKTLVFGVFNIGDTTRRSVENIIRIITANRHMQRCICYFAQRVEFEEVDALMQDVCAFVESRHGLPTLTTADYKSLPNKQQPVEAANVKVWTAFFNSPIFERQTLGIVQKFIHGAYDRCLQERIDKIRFE